MAMISIVRDPAPYRTLDSMLSLPKNRIGDLLRD